MYYVLRTKLEEIAENLEETQRMLAYMFKAVFVHRYRDVVPEIRSLCLTELGVWLMECPMVFLEDSYLKYLGWSLHDKVGCVRLASIKSLQQLYNCREMIDKLVLLTDKFKERLVSLILDKDIEVSVCAIQLLECLVFLPPCRGQGCWQLFAAEAVQLYNGGTGQNQERQDANAEYLSHKRLDSVLH